MTPEQRIAELEAENLRLKARAEKTGTLKLKVSDKGALSVYGLGRFPVTLYRSQWERLLGASPAIADFITSNSGSLATKD